MRQFCLFDVAIQPEVRFIAKQNSAYENRRQSRFRGTIRTNLTALLRRVVRGTGSRCLRLAVVCEKISRERLSTSSSEEGSAAINQMRWAAREGRDRRTGSFPSFRRVRFGGDGRKSGRI
ncbi:hypothetical protein TNCV_2906881 [Trichonephila clavipes]|nr:hypothetical protein TNCV_2906881 [Trichonephila clavipes]